MKQCSEERKSGAGGEDAAATARRIQQLEAELRRKDQALAETAALLALTKKVQAL